MLLQLIKEEDIAEVLDIYAPYVQNTAITFECEVPTLENFSERVHHYTEQYPWIVAKTHGKIVGYAYASLYRSREAYSGVVSFQFISAGKPGNGFGTHSLFGIDGLTDTSGLLYGLRCDYPAE